MTDKAEPLRFALKDFRPASFAERGAHVPFTSPILAQARLRVCARGLREVVIEEFGSTVPVHPGFRATVDLHGNLLIERDAA